MKPVSERCWLWKEQFQTAGARRKSAVKAPAKRGSIVHPFSKVQYPTAPGVKSLDTQVGAWHATTFTNENTGFQRKLLKGKASF